MSAHEETVIVANGLSKTFPGGVQAVSALNLAVPRGSVYGLIGKNGAGWPLPGCWRYALATRPRSTGWPWVSIRANLRIHSNRWRSA